MNTQRKNDYEQVPTNWRTVVRNITDSKFSNIGKPSSKKIMFLGDSHVRQLYPLIRDIYDSGACMDMELYLLSRPAVLP